MVVVTAFVFSQFLVLRNFFVPIAVLGLSSLTLFYLRKKVDAVMADERDYRIGGRSALLAIHLTSWIGAIAAFVLYALGGKNPSCQPIAMTLALSVCVLMLTYSAVFKFYGKHPPKDEKRD